MQGHLKHSTLSSIVRQKQLQVSTLLSVWYTHRKFSGTPCFANRVNPGPKVISNKGEANLKSWKAQVQSSEVVFKMVCASIASSFSSLTTLTIFYCIVCPIKPVILISTVVASFFSGALAALEGNTGKADRSNNAGSKSKVDASDSHSSSSNATSFGCVMGLATGLLSGYFTKSLEQPWRK
ncbi:hypothetical protein XU18_1015 [Perkinsela sp. CCAP 1560/4]|nr:hypothetical protein XU18_1015 [Perkinsela sp. CCAP 1560/4]|eukprot:KNH08446.1 hypothetical protein XU18_1015 [Perkinsela sp. CCAP 1560/4]